METAAAPPASFAGTPSDSSTPTTFEEDVRHCAITASQVPKPTSSTSTPPSIPLPAAVGETNIKGGVIRCHEDILENDVLRQSLRSSRQSIAKAKDTTPSETEKKKPLELLDLPIDILKDIVKEVTHTNDLTSLALCHSALHRLTIPHIYSRFDIVWPDTSTHAEPRSGVDALTYGLATLVMAEEIFGESASRQQSSGNRFNKGRTGKATETTIRRRRGNHYAQYTRKFSLGNGPPDWVQEYLITKEGGKMLGTLVALAVARMRALETFVWDMPTGILRDVWLALSSLDDRDDGRSCRLEKVWVRWHDNSCADTGPPAQPMPPPMINHAGFPNHSTSNDASTQTTAPRLHPSALDRVEHPSFSILSPLKSLSVLDVDELPYLDEMAVLIGKSKDKLRELRVGVARHAVHEFWVPVWAGDTLKQVDHDNPTMGSLTIDVKRHGGILGILTGFVYDVRNLKRTNTPGQGDQSEPRASSNATVEPGPDMSQPRNSAEMAAFRNAPTPPLDSMPEIADALPPVAHSEDPEAASQEPTEQTSEPEAPPTAPIEECTHSGEDAGQNDQEKAPAYLSDVLRLEILELERVPVSVPVLQNAIDLSTLTSLTLLDCGYHEQLWKTLRRAYAPTPKSPTYPQPRRSSNITPKKHRLSYGGNEPEMVYGLRLKKIHTNTVTPALIAFLKETLAPNSLEVLFLQERQNFTSTVTIDAIYKGPLRRHRNSLKKLLIDSSDKGDDGLPIPPSRWRRWMATREILSFICSGKMPWLKELGVVIDYRDWHFFLQHLPAIPHLRSLYIPFLADHVHGPTADPRELAMQVLDIVALRPEVELCYMGIANKCFEILENKREWDSLLDSRMVSGAGMDDVTSEAEDDEDEDDLDDVDDIDDLDTMDDTESDDDDEDDDDTDSELDGSTPSKHSARLRLREILFYDDKVAIFKARHGRL